MKSNIKSSTLSLVQVALFAAIIVVMAFTPFLGYIPLGVTRATIIHVPVIIGSILFGPKKGAILGAVFGTTSLLINTFTPTITSFTFSPFYAGGNLWSLVICFVPRILVGVVPYYVYKGLSRLFRQAKKKGLWDTLSLGAAAICGSLVNTGLVMSLIYLCFGKSYAAAKEVSYDLLYKFILSVVAVNGIPEAIVAAVLTAVICKVLMRFLRSGSTGAATAVQK